jgi:hypothetical protein
MNISVKALAAAAMLALPAGVQAQAPFDPSVAVRIVSFPFMTLGTGYGASGQAGGFLADFEFDAPVSATFDDYLVWCIDPNRTISVPGGPYAYAAFTAANFANATLGSANGHDVTVGDMGKIVWLVSDLSTNWATYTTAQRADRQGSIWATFRGETPALSGISSADINGWKVLYNGQNQTFLTYVSEPADAALIVSALFGMAFTFLVRRRRA